jgi:hypothetical protein
LRFGGNELEIRSLHLSDMTMGLSDELMQQGEMGDVKEIIGPNDFPGIETRFEPIA